MYTKSENKIEEYLIKKCKEYNIFISKVPPSTRGIPDRILIKNGITVFIELKKESLSDTKNEQQKQRIKQINDHGGIALIIHTQDQINNLVQTLSSITINTNPVKQILEKATKEN